MLIFYFSIKFYFFHETMIKFIISLFLILVPLSHPIHVSITEINWNESTKSLEIAHKIFIDDLEDALEKQFNLRFYLATNKEHEETDIYLKKYLSQHFELHGNQKSLICHYLGKEYEEKAVWIFAEVQGIRKLKNLEVRNAILVDLYADQDNLLHFQKNKKHIKSIRTNRLNLQDQIAIPN